MPIKTTIEDVEKTVAYLKTKPTGATIAEAKAVIDGRHLDGRKLKGYEVWGLVKSDGGRLTLTDEGRKLARNPGEGPAIYRAAVKRIPLYRGAIEWGYHQGFEALDLADLAAHWHQQSSDALGTTNETTIKDIVSCFFNLAAGARLGKYTLGRRGMSTRLDLDKVAVQAFVDSEPEHSDQGVDTGDGEDTAGDVVLDAGIRTESITKSAYGLPPSPGASIGELRVFVAHGKNMRVVDQVTTILGVAGIATEVAEDEETTAVPVPEKVLGSMRRSSAGIICVSVDEGHKTADGKYQVNSNVLIEIGAAFVLYDQRVILLWDRRIDVPSNLQGLYRCEFEGDEVGWDSGMKLMKAVQSFRAT